MTVKQPKKRRISLKCIFVVVHITNAEKHTKRKLSVNAFLHKQRQLFIYVYIFNFKIGCIMCEIVFFFKINRNIERRSWSRLTFIKKTNFRQYAFLTIFIFVVHTVFTTNIYLCNINTENFLSKNWTFNRKSYCKENIYTNSLFQNFNMPLKKSF